MFEYIHNNRKVVQLFLALIMLPFAFWGVESYVSRAGGGNEIATIASTAKISVQEWQQALREQQEHMRQQLGGREVPAEMLDNPELRQSVLDSLINRRILALHAAKSNLTVGDAQLIDLIQHHPGFLEDGKYVPERYDAFVAQQNLSKVEFENRLRQNILLQQPIAVVRDSPVTGRASSDHWIAALQEERSISEIQLKPESFLAQVKLGEDAAKTYYETNRKMFETPEQVRAEFLVLSQDALAEQVAVNDQEIASWYQAHADRYKQGEERQASHILITVPKDASDAVVRAGEGRASELLGRLRKTPGDFAKLAKQYSQDTGSASKGGDLGWFGRGMMVKSFDDAVFSLKENETSGLVRSDFGFHIIRLTGIKAAKMRSQAEVRSEIIDTLKHQGAARKYAELAESFGNTVYEQSDSLNPAAEKFKLTIQQSPWLSKHGGAGNGPLGHPKLITALFSEDAIKSKRNTEAVEVAPNTLIAARMLEHKPATQLTLESVKAEIEKRLIREEAIKLVKKEGEARLAKLIKGETTGATWTVTQPVSRIGAHGIAPDALRAIFVADAAKLPAYAGAALPDGNYALYRINEVKPYVGAAGEDSRTKVLRQQYDRIITEEDFLAWLAALRLRYPVEINKAMLERKDMQ